MQAVDGAGLARRIELWAPQGGSHYVLIRGRAGAAAGAHELCAVLRGSDGVLVNGPFVVNSS